MGIPVLIMGGSGQGKSTSLRNFNEGEVGIFNVAGKRLPFKKKLPMANKPDYMTIYKVLKNAKMRAYIVDDSQYLMTFESFARAKETGYGKNIDLARNFYNLVQSAIDAPENVIVYFLHHTEQTDDGRVKAKTLGKMLDNQLTLEGLFSIVLLAQRTPNGYMFIANSDGTTTAKSPMDMFESMEIENDLKAVDTAIREYYELLPLVDKEVSTSN